MDVRNIRRALLLVALAAVAWLAGGLYYGDSVLDQFMLGLVAIGAGFALAAWGLARARWPTVAGFALALVGILLFLGRNLGRLDRASRVGSHVFALALAVLALATARPRASVLGLRIGGAVVVLATLFWMYGDLDEPGWEPGNILACAGGAWAALRAGERVP